MLDIDLLHMVTEFLRAPGDAEEGYARLVSAEAGRLSAFQAANLAWKQALAEHEDPPLDPAIAKELDAFVTRRIAEGGEPTDF